MQKRILEGNLKSVIKDLTIPGYFGMLGMNIFNIIDTFFVSLLGTYELAAMSFTFSVVMIVNLITIGLGAGIGTLVSKAVGNSDEQDKIHVVMTGLGMSLILSLCITIVGLLTIEPFFTFIGADSITLSFIHDYMFVWYFGCTFLFMSMVGGQIFRGLGDTKTPGNLMIIAAVLNTILDPIMIFGLFFFPAMGMTGAALATVISRFFTCFMYFYQMSSKYHVIRFKSLEIKRIKSAAKRIIKIGLPNSLTKVVNPVIVTIITALLATQSQIAVAGYGVGTKIESFILALAIALGNTAMAVIGQNYGAKNHGRINEALKIFNRFSAVIFTFIYIIVFIFAPIFASIFSSDPDVIAIIVIYLRILPLSYAMQSIYLVSTSFYNILGKPFLATILSFGQLIFIIIPFATISFNLFGIYGLFIVVMLSHIILASVSLIFNKKLSQL